MLSLNLCYHHQKQKCSKNKLNRKKQKKTKKKCMTNHKICVFARLDYLSSTTIISEFIAPNAVLRISSQ